MKIDVTILHEGSEKKQYGSGALGFGANNFSDVVENLMRYEEFQLAIIRYYHDELASHLMKKKNAAVARQGNRALGIKNANKPHTASSAGKLPPGK